MDQLEALKAENETLKNLLKNANAEKAAIDQLCINSLRENVATRTQLIVLQNEHEVKTAKLAELESQLASYNANVLPLVESA